MALASTRPIIVLAERAMGKVAALGSGTPAAWWFATLTIGPLLGSFITEPAAMTICALLLSRQFFDLNPSQRLKYATLGLLFVNVSIGGTLTHFAAPPILMVARPWGWDLSYVMTHFGWRTLLAVFGSALLYFAMFRDRTAGAGDASGGARPRGARRRCRRRRSRHAAARARVDHRRARHVHGVDGGERALSRRCSSVASCSSWGS